MTQAEAKELHTMSLSILNNISALSAENSMSTTQANLSKTLVQLSTGMRINSGSDDAAGLSIANGLTANISALTQSGQNATNTTGLLQTADGALSQVTSLLNRAVTLATEASSNGLSTSQSKALDTEFQSILSSINNIGSQTNYNGSQVFTASAINPFLSDGTTAPGSSTGNNNMLGTQTMSVGTLSTTGLGLQSTATGSLTMTDGKNATTGDTVVVGSTTYTFTAAGTAPTKAGEVEAGANANATLQNLAAAVNGTDGLNSANALATAGVPTSGDVLTFTATTAGAGVAAGTGTAGTGDNVALSATIAAGGASATAFTGGATAAGDLLSVSDAKSALTAITAAINTVSATRGSLGADINQLTAASNVMTSQVQNLQSADNGIMNADIGKTVANMTQYNVLQSTGMSALQQANQAQQAVLKLLQ
jgi:flagellin